MVDRGEAGGMREPGGATRLRISGGAEGGGNQGGVTGRRAKEERREPLPEVEPRDPHA